MKDLLLEKKEGGLGAVKGMQLAGISAGFRKNPERLDLALIVAPEGARAAGVFTQSAFAAAPVQLCREHLAKEAAGDGFKALVINSGNANAATGAQGMQTAQKTCALTAELLACKAEQVLVASTGVIGVQLPFVPFETGLPQALKVLSPGAAEDTREGTAVAKAIMTTDTRSKTAACSFTFTQRHGGEARATVGGMAKGSGMIAPHMATMIAVLATDLRIEQETLQYALKEAVTTSFNKVTIDTDTSTNDSAYLIATGAAMDEEETIDRDHPAYPAFKRALKEVCEDLTYQIAQDGEGATKVIIVDVEGAASEEEADRAARSVADSPLVKTAIAGHDANWGRIAMALGKSGAHFDQAEVSISIMDLAVLVKGTPLEFSEEEAKERFAQRDEVRIVANLCAGNASTRIWTCDLTHGYIEINGDYRT